MTLLSYVIAPYRNTWLRMRCNMQQFEQDSFNLGLVSAKIAPSWSPERDKHYPLRTWVTDVRLWAVGTDTDPNKQGPVAAMRIGGTARELIRELDANVLVHGMAFADENGNLVQHTGLECLIRALSRRFAPLQQELEVHVISEILQFRRLPGEDTDAVISRFEIVRDRALNGANFDMSHVGFAFLLLCVLGIPKQQWPLLLAPTQGALPQNAAQYQAFCQYARRNGHMQDRNVDGVKNMSFYTTPTDEYYTQPSLAPAFAAWNVAEQFADHSSSYVDLGHNTADEISSCNSGETDPDISDLFQLSYNQAGEKLYLAYRHNKRRWRKFTGGFKRGKGGGKSRKGKGMGKGFIPGGGFGTFGGGKSRKGKGKRKSKSYFQDESGQIWTEPEEEDWTGMYYETEPQHAEGNWYDDLSWGEELVYIGKGKFRRKNPKGKDGKTLLCSMCNSDEHFVRNCPKNKQGLSHAQTQPGQPKTFASIQSEASASSDQTSRTGTDWGAYIYMGGAQEIQHNSISTIEFADGTMKHLDSLNPIAEESDSARDQTLTSTANLRYYHLPNAPMPKQQAQLSRSQDTTSQGNWSRQFAFMWFMPAAFHAQVRLKDQGEALLVDVGAWENLVGSIWVDRVEETAKKAGQGCVWHKLKRMLSVEGVGQKANEASNGVTVPICLEDGSTGNFKSAVIPNSELPALLGLSSISKLKGLVDTHHKQIIFVGPGGYRLQLSPGSKAYPLYSAPTGHLMLPCQCWDKAKVKPGQPGIDL